MSVLRKTSVYINLPTASSSIPKISFRSLSTRSNFSHSTKLPSRSTTSSSRLVRPTASPSKPLVKSKLERGFAASPVKKNGESSTSTPEILVASLTQSEYDEISDRDMNLLHENLEILVEQYGPVGWEVEYDSGVMTLTLPPHGTYVINKQPPNQQIWMSSPISGPSRFSYSPQGTWVHHRRVGVGLGGLLEGEIRGFMKEDKADEGWEGVGLK